MRVRTNFAARSELVNRSDREAETARAELIRGKSASGGEYAKRYNNAGSSSWI